MQNLLKQTKDLCRIYGIRPARSKGQNFLINENVYDMIIGAAELSPDDTVLEVGPGLGFLTARLAKKAGKVIAVELDDKLAGYLKSAVKAQRVKNVEIINGNILDVEISNDEFLMMNKFRNSNLEIRNFKVVANLPYNITSVFIRRFLSEVEIKPEMMVLMLQKEVAQRIVAKPGQMSLLAVSVRFYADAEIIGYVPKQDFWPAPEVDSAVVRIRLKKNNPLNPPYQGDKNNLTAPLIRGVRGVDEKSFFRLVKFGFSAKRKMLKNNLSSGYHISQADAEERIARAGFDPKARAQELSVEDWMRLFGEFEGNVV